MNTPPPRPSPVEVPGTPLYGPSEFDSPARSTQRRSSRQKTSTFNSPPPRTASEQFTPPSTGQVYLRKGVKRSRASTTVTLGDGTSTQPSKEWNAGLLNDNGMLPTPMKTPRKREIPANQLASTARALFPTTTTTSTTQITKANTKAKVSSDIPIYVDSNARIPEWDLSPSNPFNKEDDNEGHISSRTRKNKTKSIIKPPTKDGMVFVFRGKKVYKRFSDLRSRSRSSVSATPEREAKEKDIRPRVLFPTERQMHEDEEDSTDIDDSAPTASQDGEGRISRLEDRIRRSSSPFDEKFATGKVPKSDTISPRQSSNRSRGKKRSAKLATDDDPKNNDSGYADEIPERKGKKAKVSA